MPSLKKSREFLAGVLIDGPDFLALILLRFATAGSLLVVAAILYAGFQEIHRAFINTCPLMDVLNDFFMHTDTKPKALKVSIAEIMTGIEYFFLAPLPYVLLRTVAAYLSDIRRKPDGTPEEKTVRSLISVKALSIGLLIAVLATHLVGHLISPETSTPSIEPDSTVHSKNNSADLSSMNSVLPACLVLVVLAGYLLMLESLGKEPSSEASKEEELKDKTLAEQADDAFKKLQEGQ